MTNILDTHFPESDRPPDVLLGLKDDSDGNAAQFFGMLDASDREIVQHYLQNFIAPVSLMGRDVESYVSNLVAGYAVVDPARSSYEGVQAALYEVARLQRYLEIFAEGEGYFPWVGQDVQSFSDDETGELVVVTSNIWTDLEQSVGLYGTDYLRDRVTKNVLPIVRSAAFFLVDPNDNEHFSQDYILYKHAQMMDEEKAIYGSRIGGGEF